MIRFDVLKPVPARLLDSGGAVFTQISKKFCVSSVGSNTNAALSHGTPVQVLTVSPKPATKVNSLPGGATATVVPLISIITPSEA